MFNDKKARGECKMLILYKICSKKNLKGYLTVTTFLITGVSFFFIKENLSYVRQKDKTPKACRYQ